MRVETLGRGTPEVAVVGGIHGDEPSGVAAVERLMADPPEVERPVKLVVANEAAVEQGVRYLEADLNRSFPGVPDSETHEARLAADLVAELSGLTVLALHSTQSHPDPFAIVSGVDDLARETVPRLPVVAAVDTGTFVEGRLFSAADVVEVEVGLQGSDRAVENAHAITDAFLRAAGVYGDQPPAESVPLYRLRGPLPKPDARAYATAADNFERVEAGETYASADGEPVVASEPFYPVLLSAYGYEDVFGYAADYRGELG